MDFSVLTITKMLEVLEKAGKLDRPTVESIEKFVADNIFQVGLETGQNIVILDIDLYILKP